jgi:putative transcription antitermination factor YqgF
VSRLLGVDLGTRRVGLAVADTATGEVRPMATLRRAPSVERDAERIVRFIDEQRIDELIVGLPLNMDGSEGEQASQTRAWGAAIVPLVPVPVGWRDERLTSEVAEVRTGLVRRGRSGGAPSPAARNAHRARIDREAAANILQAELDARAAAATPAAPPATAIDGAVLSESHEVAGR